MQPQAKILNVSYASKEAYENFIREAKENEICENTKLTQSQAVSLMETDFYIKNHDKILFYSWTKHSLDINHSGVIANQTEAPTISISLKMDDSHYNGLFEVHTKPYKKTLTCVYLYKDGKCVKCAKVKNKKYQSFLDGKAIMIDDKCIKIA